MGVCKDYWLPLSSVPFGQPRRLFLCAGLACALPAQPNRRNERLAAFLLTLLRFTEWPPKTAPHTIGLLPNAGLESCLMALCAGRLIQNRSVHIRSIRSPADALDCDLLFVGPLDNRQLDVLIYPLTEKPVLTVGESASFHTYGGVVHILSADETIRFSVHLDNLARSGLRISSKLMRHGVTAGRPSVRSQL